MRLISPGPVKDRHQEDKTVEASPSPVPFSPLMLADRLITLAEDADRAGLRRTAGHLVRLAERACTERPRS